jgi:hypothetical protein
MDRGRNLEEAGHSYRDDLLYYFRLGLITGLVAIASTPGRQPAVPRTRSGAGSS